VEGIAKQRKDLKDIRYLLYEPKATTVRNWLLFGVEILLLVVIGFYAVETYRLRKETEKTVKLINEEINLSLEPRLSLGGHRDKTKYIDYINSREEYTEDDILKYTEAAEAVYRVGGYYYYFKNVSPNTAFQTVLIGYETKERRFSVSYHSINYILPGSMAMTFLATTEDESELREYLIKVYERDVLAALRTNCVLSTSEYPWCFVLLYLDYTNNLYALRREGGQVEGQDKGLSLPKYYNLGREQISVRNCGH
jgi:hypothetical protein